MFNHPITNNGKLDQNLFGFFALLYKVDQRLKKEKNINDTIEDKEE